MDAAELSRVLIATAQTGTLPLLLAIAWLLWKVERRISRVEFVIERMEKDNATERAIYRNTY